MYFLLVIPPCKLGVLPHKKGQSIKIAVRLGNKCFANYNILLWVGKLGGIMSTLLAMRAGYWCWQVKLSQIVGC